MQNHSVVRPQIFQLNPTCSRTLEGYFHNVNATRYGSFDAKTFDSEYTNITNWEENPTTADPGYLMGSVINNSSLFGANGTGTDHNGDVSLRMPAPS